MMDSTHALSISRQAQRAGISRGSVYDVPTSVGAADLGLMRRLDALHLEHPFMGARMVRDQLNREGDTVGRKHVGTLMARMGMAALSRKPRTSKKHPGHEMYPYLLRGLNINRANQVWALDTTYIPKAQGFVSLTARGLGQSQGAGREGRHPAGDLSRGRGVARGVHVPRQAGEGAYRPGPSVQRTGVCACRQKQGCQFSMDGRGAWRDHVFVERLWKLVKYERVYWYAYDSVTEARQSIMPYRDWYNRARPHSSLGKHTPDEAYAVMLPTGKLAA